MAVLFVTLCLVPDAVIPVLQRVWDPGMVVILCSYAPEGRETKEAVRKSCESIGVKSKQHALSEGKWN